MQTATRFVAPASVYSPFRLQPLARKRFQAVEGQALALHPVPHARFAQVVHDGEGELAAG
jgi:hypothetical protein